MKMNKCKHRMVCEDCQTDCQYFTEHGGFTRLTASGNRLCHKCANAATCEIDRRFAGKEKCLLEQIYERLSEYEDAGLTPMQIKELLEENKNAKNS